MGLPDLTLLPATAGSARAKNERLFSNNNSWGAKEEMRGVYLRIFCVLYVHFFLKKKIGLCKLHYLRPCCRCTGFSATFSMYRCA